MFSPGQSGTLGELGPALEIWLWNAVGGPTEIFGKAAPKSQVNCDPHQRLDPAHGHGEFQLAARFLRSSKTTDSGRHSRRLTLVVIPPVLGHRPRVDFEPAQPGVRSGRPRAEHIACCCPQKEGMRLRVEDSGKTSEPRQPLAAGNGAQYP